MNIIIVDDEMAALSTFLYDIIKVHTITYKLFLDDPNAAVEYVSTHFVDAAFLDICMPAMDGVALAEKLIKVNPGIQIVFITGFAQDAEDIKRRTGANLLGFCNKPYDKKLMRNFIGQIRQLTQNRRDISIRTFGCFDLFVGDVPVKFSYSKSKELLALLVDKNGAFLNLGEAIACLWPDKQSEHAKNLYRDAVYRLRMVLRENNLLPLIKVERAAIAINKENIDCDYWNYLNGEKVLYTGSYMPSYDWSLGTQSQIEILLK